jgi:phospholipid-binding lipoprotein MlaA
MSLKNLSRIVCFAFFAILLGGCASNPNDIDPWEKNNRAMYQFNENLDHYALKPIADGYRKFVPEPIRMGLGNMFDNLAYFNVILNDFLQAKWDQGWSDSGRMLVATSKIPAIPSVLLASIRPEYDHPWSHFA